MIKGQYLRGPESEAFPAMLITLLFFFLLKLILPPPNELHSYSSQSIGRFAFILLEASLLESGPERSNR